MHPILVILIISYLLEHHAEQDAEENRCQDTTLLHAVVDGNGFMQVTFESDLALLVLVQLNRRLYAIRSQPRISHSPVLLIESKAYLRSTRIT